MFSILTQSLNHARQRLADALLPGSCLLCGSDSGPQLLCPDCCAELPPLPAPCCPQCSLPTTYGERCGGCLKNPPAFSRSIAVFSYQFPVDRIIHAFKYGHQLAIADWAAAQLRPQIDAANYDLIIPLALHPERLRQRGFNQAAEIARRLSHTLHLPLDTQSLHRIRVTTPQAELTLKERERNVRGAFACVRDLSGQRILLVDDVMTTGATLREAATTLRHHGAADIDLALIARALKHDQPHHSP